VSVVQDLGVWRLLELRILGVLRRGLIRVRVVGRVYVRLIFLSNGCLGSDYHLVLVFVSSCSLVILALGV
jgi:hypothetical protein